MFRLRARAQWLDLSTHSLAPVELQVSARGQRNRASLREQVTSRQSCSRAGLEERSQCSPAEAAVPRQRQCTSRRWTPVSSQLVPEHLSTHPLRSDARHTTRQELTSDQGPVTHVARQASRAQFSASTGFLPEERHSLSLSRLPFTDSQ